MIHKKLSKIQGFTLVELLVVIAIIAILAGVVLVAINPTALLQKSRDAARLSDLDSIHKSMSLALADSELVLTDTSACATCNSVDGTQAVDGTGWIQFTIPAGKTGLVKYLPILPRDPTNDQALTLQYVYGSDALVYELNAVLESTDNAAKMSTDGGDNAGVYELGTGYGVLN